MKQYKKSNLTFVNGYIVDKKGNALSFPGGIEAFLLNLEYYYQLAEYNEANAVDASVLEAPKKFKFKHLAKKTTIEVETPELDKAIKRTKKLMKDIEIDTNTAKVNDWLSKNAREIEWIQADTVMATKDGDATYFDLHTIGNPLKLDFDTLINMVYRIVENNDRF